MSLAILQIVQSLFWILITSIATVGVLQAFDENNKTEGYYTGTQKIFLVIIPIVLFVLIVSLILSTILIFVKRKAGIFFSYVSIAAAIFAPILIAIYSSYLENVSNPSDNFGVGAIIGFACFGCIFWGAQLALLLVSPSRRNVKESFR